MIYKEKPVLGIPVNQAVVLTPYADAQAMLTDFAKKGVCTAVQYLNFSNHAAQNERGGIEASGTLGGRKAWNSLLEDAKTGGTPVYATTNFLSFTSDGALVSRFTLAAVQLSSFPVKLNRYLISTHKTDANAAADYVLKAEKVSQEAQSALSAYEALGADVALGDAANLLYSDYSQDNGLRDTLKAGIEVLYAQTEGALESFPNAYALPCAALVCDVTFASSGFSCADETVPFYAYVLRGHVPFATEAVNLSDEPAHTLLHAMETGADLAFTFVTQNSSELQFSDKSDLYACSYAEWKDTAADMYRSLCDVRNQTDALEIAARQEDGGLVDVLYADGTRLLLNYSDTARETEAGVLAPGGWQLLVP